MAVEVPVTSNSNFHNSLPFAFHLTTEINLSCSDTAVYQTLLLLVRGL